MLSGVTDKQPNKSILFMVFWFPPILHCSLPFNHCMDVYLKEEQQLILLPMQHYDLNALEGIGLIHIWWFLVLISMHVLPSKSSTGLLLFMHNSCWVHFTVVWTSLGPLPRWVPGPTTRWAPGTTRLALHGIWWRGAHGLQRNNTRLGSCTCSALYGGLLDVLD
jgi:hypothetical protein